MTALNRALKTIMLAVCLVLLATACSKTPHGVISEGKMEDLLVDLLKADVYVSMYPDQYPNDSTMQALKQSIFAQHGVTQNEFEASMVWYAHNLDVYNDVYDRVVKQLTSEQKDLSKQMDNGGGIAANDGSPAQAAAGLRGNMHPTYSNHGDSADLWQGRRVWLLASALPRGYVTFDLKPDGEYRSGDRYRLDFKLVKASGVRCDAVVGVDYTDGSTSLVMQQSLAKGWNSVELQSDNSRQVRRIYGYVSYNIAGRPMVAFVDSISLLRTHYDQAKYQSIKFQRFYSRSLHAAAPVSQPAQAPVRAVAPPQTFTPKPGVNKSGHSPIR